MVWIWWIVRLCSFKRSAINFCVRTRANWLRRGFLTLLLLSCRRLWLCLVWRRRFVRRCKVSMIWSVVFKMSIVVCMWIIFLLSVRLKTLRWKSRRRFKSRLDLCLLLSLGVFKLNWKSLNSKLKWWKMNLLWLR